MSPLPPHLLDPQSRSHYSATVTTVKKREAWDRTLGCWLLSVSTSLGLSGDPRDFVEYIFRTYLFVFHLLLGWDLAPSTQNASGQTLPTVNPRSTVLDTQRSGEFRRVIEGNTARARWSQQ